MMNKKDKRVEQDKILDVDASMQGSLIFKDPVNLRINGRFDGTLSTKGNLMIGEHAVVNADIIGDSIVIAGKVNGHIRAIKELKMVSPARVIGDIKTPLLSVAEGAVFEGNSKMLAGLKPEDGGILDIMTPEELAKYLEIDTAMVFEWANLGKLPAIREGNSWKFDRNRIEEWVATEKIK
jgi:excisionase family DNA binding protein